MRSIKVLFDRIKEYDPTWSDTLSFTRAISGRNFSMKSIRTNYKNLVSFNEREFVQSVSIIKFFENHTKKGNIFEVPYGKQNFIRSSLRYKNWRDLIIERDNSTCQLCDNTTHKPEVDHIVPLCYIINVYDLYNSDKPLDCEDLWKLENGRVLCHKCHKKTETYGLRAKKYSF